MSYAMKFNIANKLNIEALNRRLGCAATEFHDDLYIFMSPDTLMDMPRLEDYYEYTGKSTCNNCTGRVGSYKGYKVFSDPSMKYGEVELR